MSNTGDKHPSNSSDAQDDAQLDRAFSRLDPDAVIHAFESLGFWSDGRVLALNSYENRVFQVGVEDAVPMIIKFYRPQRWRAEQIAEEHEFCAQLTHAGWPVVAPWRDEHDATLFSARDGLLFSVFKRCGGRAPELDNFEHLHQLGICIAQLHGQGRQQAFEYRPALTIQSYGVDSVEFLLEHFIPSALREAYSSLTQHLLERIAQVFERNPQIQWIRTHSDCHLGNILWRDEAPHFVDFDDARMAPAIQDLWMLLSGDRQQQSLQLEEVLAGYELFQTFDYSELQLIEPLRTLRMLHYSAWLGRRWSDPAFPHHFPWFNSERYWGEHILQLREQLALLNEPVLSLSPQ